MTKIANRQFIGMERIYRQTGKGELSYGQANRQLQELLCLTMPPVDSGRVIYRMPSRTEYMMWNHMAINLRDAGKVEEALCIYEELMQCYKRSKVSMRYHAVPGLTLYINYAGFLEINNELEKAEAVGREGLHHCMECCRGDMAGDILANMSLVYGKQGLPDVEEEYLRYGYYLVELYGRKNLIGILQDAYRDKFHKEIDYDVF